MRHAQRIWFIVRRLLTAGCGPARPASLLILALLATAQTATAQEDSATAPWRAGPYSFSDELGGFHILGVSGTGSKDDPVVIREEMVSATPVTMTIRIVGPIRPFDANATYANGILYMRMLALNNSGKGWVEFEFELQEILGKASVFGDGLSFDQKSSEKKNISSDSFGEFSRDFEPYDKLLFRDGKVDPLKSASFSFLVTDFTPKRQFYLVQDPRIPLS